MYNVTAFFIKWQFSLWYFKIAVVGTEAISSYEYKCGLMERKRPRKKKGMDCVKNDINEKGVIA